MQIHTIRSYHCCAFCSIPVVEKFHSGFCFASFAIHLLGLPHSRVNLCYVFTEYFIFPVQCPSPCCVKISKMLPKGFSSARSIYNTEWVFFNHMPLLTSLQTDDVARCSPSSGFISHPHFLIAKVFTPTATQRCPICCRHSRDPFLPAPGSAPAPRLDPFPHAHWSSSTRRLALLMRSAVRNTANIVGIVQCQGPFLGTSFVDRDNGGEQPSSKLPFGPPLFFLCQGSIITAARRTGPVGGRHGQD